MKALHADFSNKVKTLRESLTPYMSQESFAEAVGVSVASVSRWERGIKIPPMKTLEKIAKILGQPVAFFLNQGVTMKTVEPTPTLSELLRVIDNQEKRIKDLQLQLDQAQWKTQQFEKLKSKVEKLERPKREHERAKNKIALGVIVEKQSSMSEEEIIVLNQFRKLKSSFRKAAVFYALSRDQSFLDRLLESPRLTPAAKEDLEMKFQHLVSAFLEK